MNTPLSLSRLTTMVSSLPNKRQSQKRSLPWLIAACLLLTLLPLASLAQTITGSTPAKNANAAPVTTNVSITSSAPFAGGAASAIKVFSAQAGGKKAGTATVSGNTLTFDPAANFKPGETVFTSLTTASGLAKAHVYQFTTAAAVASGSFSGTTNVAVGNQPGSVIAADVNGDGYLDILTHNVVSHNVSVRINDGSGAFSGATNVAVGSTPSSVAAADVDGDGDLDILASNAESDNVSIRLNNGSGTFSGSTDVAVGDWPLGVAAADVDGDGDLDILSANNTGQSVSVRLNNGSGAFSGSTEVAVASRISEVAAADVDGDGDLDILTAGYYSDNVSVRLNNGNGTFSGSTDVPVGDYPSSVAAADVDGDGDLDILSANKNSHNVSVRLNNGSGAFSSATDVVVGHYPASVAAADVDGDGDLDILSANQSSNTVSVRLNDGSGAFSSATDVVVGHYPASVAAADVDGDGDLDILSANELSDNVSVRLNQPIITLSPINKASKEDVTVTFSSSDFTNAFSGGSLSKVKITSLPDASTGVLQVSGVAVTLNQEIAVADLATLTFVPAANYNGSASFNWNGTEGSVYAASDAAVNIMLAAVNDAPSFVKGADQTVLEDARLQTVSGWATAISKGPSDEFSQTISFIIISNNNSLFSTLPAVSDNGTLTYTPAAHANGSAIVSVKIKDDGGTTSAGVDESPLQTFTITVNPVNDAPSFTKGADQTVNEDAGLQTVTGWATAISKGPANESSQTIDFIVTNTNNGLFSAQPAVADNGTLTYTSAAHANGSATVSVKIKDDGGTVNSGIDESTIQTFTITVNAVNDAPSFVIAGNPATVNEDVGAQTVTNFATNLEDGDPELNQTLTFTITGNSNGSLFSVAPAISSTGALTYTPAAHANGTALIKLTLSDNGLGSDPHVNTSMEKTFTITVNPVNDAPSFTKGADQTVHEDAGTQTVSGWATAISAGPSDESSQTISFIVTNTNNGLFSAQPAISTDGTLTYTPAANAFGLATVSVKLKDDGGTDLGGIDVSALQTFTITVTAVNDAPLVLATPATQQVQYSDLITPVAISGSDVDNELSELTATLFWKLATAASFTDGLPAALELKKESAGNWTLSGRMMMAPGNYIVRVRVNDGTADASNNFAYTDIAIVVLPEDARVTYTGALFASTSGATSSKATVTLSATIQDITAVLADPAYDIFAGDIRNARVKFVNRDNGSDISGWLTPGLVTASDLKTGTVTFNWAIDIGSKSYETYTVGILVNNYYTRNASLDNTTVNVSKPLTDFITGGGFVTLTTASGLIKPKQGTKNNFGFNVKYNKSGTNLQGNINTIVRGEDGKVYQVKGNVMTSLSVNSTNKTAIFNGKANIQDITNPLAPVSVDGNATLQVNMADMGEPGTSDKIGITVWNKEGGLWFASSWDGSKTVEKTLAAGNLVIRGASKARMDFDDNIQTEPAAAVVVYPNPVVDKLTIDLKGMAAIEAKTIVTDAVGKPVLVDAHKVVGESLLEVDMSGLRSGMYLIGLRTKAAYQVVKVIKQ